MSTATHEPVADSAWESAPYPAVVLGADGDVRALNGGARALFQQGLPSWLTQANTNFRESSDLSSIDGAVDERSFAAHPVRYAEDALLWWLVEDTDTRLAEQALRVERERAAFLGAASDALLGSLNLDRCMEMAATLAAEHLADASLVIAPAHRRRHPLVRCVRGSEPERMELFVDPEDVPGLPEALQGFPPVPSRWIDPNAAPEWLVPDGFGEVGSIVVTPLPGHGVPAGALVLLRRTEHRAFSTEEEIFARLFAARSGAAMSAARMLAQQASVTDTLMRELLPPTVERVAGVEFAGRYRAAQDSDRVGGDFYDVHPVAKTATGESLAVLGDVCGKGLDAAVLTGKIRNTLHALLPMADDHLRMLTLLNGALVNSHHTRFATMVLASAERAGAHVRLRLTCAGHPPPYIVRATGTVEEAKTRGCLIGALPEVEATTTVTELAPGETCLLYTDGITEAKGGPLGDEMFGEPRLREVLAECAGLPAEAVVERVQMVALQWVGRNAHDDMAVLAITAPMAHRDDTGAEAGDAA